jgi:flagellar basal body rod protein FlgB
MNSLLLNTDNITELLIKIVEFTQRRQKILAQNINNIDNVEYSPKDLAVDEFSDLLDCAINEHRRNQRLVLFDTENIKFGEGGSFEAIPLIDNHSQRLFKENRDEYLETQIDKLLENSLNQRIATELLRQKQSIGLGF